MKIAPAVSVAALLSVALLGAGCESNKSRNPLSPSVAGPIAGVTITAPKPLEPANNHTLTAGSPIVLLIENPSTTGERPLWLQVEVASDAAFTQKVHIGDKLTPGQGGRTSYTIPVTLTAGGKRYFWRTRALDGANTGEYSPVSAFVLQDPVVIGAPTPAAPANNATLDTITPALTVANGIATGPITGPVAYRFEVATDAAFANLVAVLTVGRSTGSTTTAQVTPLAYNTLYYWRVSASDGSRTSPFTPAFSFRTPAAPAPTPTSPPPTTPSPTTPSPTTPAPTTPPPSGGGRTPDPPAGQRLPLPNMLWVVEEVARQYPQALRNSCQEHGGTWEFMDRVVDRLRQIDTRWGYNGKRGNVNDPSMDVIDYHYGPGRDEGSTDVYIIDILVGHCGSNPQPAWIDQTEVTRQGGTIGRWTSRGRF